VATGAALCDDSARGQQRHQHLLHGSTVYSRCAVALHSLLGGAEHQVCVCLYFYLPALGKKSASAALLSHLAGKGGTVPPVQLHLLSTLLALSITSPRKFYYFYSIPLLICYAAAWASAHDLSLLALRNICPRHISILFSMLHGLLRMS